MEDRSNMESPLNMNPFELNQLDETDPDDVLRTGEFVDCGPIDFPSAPRKLGFPVLASLMLNGTPMGAKGWFYLAFFTVMLIPTFGAGRFGVAVWEALSPWEDCGNGRIISCEYSGSSLKIGKKKPLQRIEFAVELPEGGTARGTCYSFDEFSPGAEAPVERRKGSRDVLRVKGASLASFGSIKTQALTQAPWFVIFYCGIILQFIFLEYVRRGFYLKRLLKNGAPARVCSVSSHFTGKKVGKKEMQAAYYEARTEKGEPVEAEFEAFDIDKRLENPTNIVLYDVENKDDAISLDGLPSNVVYDPNTGFRANLRKLTPHIIFFALFVAEIVVTLTMTFHIPHAAL